MDSPISPQGDRVGVAIITASCCFPGVAPFEEQAQRVVAQAIHETGVVAEVKVLPVSSYYHSIPREVVPRLMADYNQGKISAPPILIDGQPVFYGVPALADMKAALQKAAEARKTKEGFAREPAAQSTDNA
jgi:hypothetical protein